MKSGSSARLVFWPVAAAAATVLLAAIAGVLFFVRQVDEDGRAREETVVSHGLIARSAEVSKMVVPQVVWDDAVRYLDNKFDLNWAKDNIGTFLHQVNGFKASFVIDPDGGPLFAAIDGESRDIGEYAAFEPAARSVFELVRAQEAQAAAKAKALGSHELSAAIQADTLAKIDGQIYVLVATAVQPDFGTAQLKGARAPIALTAMLIDEAFLEAFSNRYLLDHLALAPDSRAGDATTPLISDSGERVGVLTWRPQRPGSALLGKVGAPLLLVICVVVIAALFFYQRSHRMALSLIAKQADLEVARDAAQAADRAKSTFLATMSHEIRTPLNGVLGMAQALARSPLNPEDQEKVGVILTSGESLLVLLNDVLDLSKIEAGKIEIDAVDGDLVASLRQVEALFRPLAEQKGLTFTLDYEELLEAWLRYDPARLHQCLSNLIANAIKFTDSGEVRITARTQGTDDGQRLIAVTVRDTGIGMSPHSAAKLFHSFVQADPSTSRKYGGTGLGLAISGRLARMMGGDIAVESQLGLGSTFVLTIKAEPPRLPRPTLEAETSLGSMHSDQQLRRVGTTRLLVVDDHPINRQIVRLFLSNLPVEITEAANGREALDFLEAGVFDVVLLDAHMPVMDGRECIKRIRSSKRDCASIPVIALTGEAMAGDRERFLALGMTDYLSKPVKQDDLIAAIARNVQGNVDPFQNQGVPSEAAAPMSGDVSGDDLDRILSEIDAAAA